MTKERLLNIIILLMFSMFLANNIALKFYWYYSISWFDMLMHFSGGFWLGLFFLYVFYDKNLSFKRPLAVISCVLVVGLLWEVFEYIMNVISKESFSTSDTLSDIFFDLAGGFVAIYYITKSVVKTAQNKLE